MQIALQLVPLALAVLIVTILSVYFTIVNKNISADSDLYGGNILTCFKIGGNITVCS